MNDTAEEIETIEFVARSTCRAGILASLAAEGCLSRSALRERFDVSRTTVGRNIAALEDRGLVRRTNDGYAASRTGTAVAESFDDLVDTVEVTSQVESFVEWLPEGEFDPDLGALADVEVVLADEGDPYAPVNRHDEALASVDEVVRMTVSSP